MANVGRNQHTNQLSEDLMTHLVQRIAGMLVNEPEQVVVSKLDGPEGTVFQLRVGPNDVGRVIGKKGATVKAIRTIVAAAGQRQRRRMKLEILD